MKARVVGTFTLTLFISYLFDMKNSNDLVSRARDWLETQGYPLEMAVAGIERGRTNATH
jgi:hypothetical protein